MSKAVQESDLVWAKMRGYPHWPAKVMKPPKGTKPTAHKLFVFFYGTHEHAWLLESEVFPYEQFCDKFKKPSNRKGFMEGIRELEEELAKIRKKGAGKKTASPGKQKPSEVHILSPQKHPLPITQHPSVSTERSTSDAVTTDSDTNKGQSTALTVNQEASKNIGTDNSTSCNQSASMDVFFVSQEDNSTECSQEEAPILIRKRKALRSLSHEPVKRTRSHDDSASSLPLSESESHLSPHGGRVPSARATRSLTPHHYMIRQQQVSGIEPLEEASDMVQQSVPENASKSATDVHSLVVSPVQKVGVSKAGTDETEGGVGEQVQTSSVTPEQASLEDGLAYFLSMGEEDKTSVDTHAASEWSPAKEENNVKEIDQSEAMDCTSQAEAKHSPKASHEEKEKATVEEQSGMETQAISTSVTQQEKVAKPSKSKTAKSTTTCKGSEVTSPRRYSTRRQGVAQGSTVEKLTQSYTARLEQALGSPDAHKKKPLQLQSPKKTPKGAKASLKAPVKSGGGRSGRKSRGGTRGKAESEEGGGEEDKEDKEKGEGEGEGGDDEGVIGGADSQAVSESSTTQVGVGKQGESAKEKERDKNESKPEPGRRKSARLSSKMQQTSTPTGGGGEQRKTASSGKKQKEPRSAGKKRSRQTSESSMDDGNEEMKVKIEAVDDTGQETVNKDGMEGETELQNENETTPVMKKQSKRGRKSQTAEEKAVKQSKTSKPQAPNSGGRVLRTRQKGMAGSKDKSQPKKIKLEEPSREPLTSESQQQQSDSLETSEDKQPQEESEETKCDEASSEGKRVLRKRKQASSATASAGSGSKGVASKNNTSSESASSESVSKSTPTRQSKRLKVASKAETESVDKTSKPAMEEGSEELIIRVPSSVSKVNELLANGESTREATGDKTEVASKPNDKEPMPIESTPGTSKDSNDVGDVSGGQPGGTGDQEEAPPTTCQPDESSSKADPQGSSSNAQSSNNAAAGSNEENKTAGEKDKVELPKKIDSSDLPPMIKIRAGMSTVEVLQAYNYNIKASLVIDAPNISKALTTLHDLKELQFSATDLEKVPDLVYTVRKLKHYHASSKVIRRAEEVYGKLKGLYMYPKMVSRPLKKKAVGGVGIRKRPPTMAEYLNNQQSKKQKPSQLSRSQTHSKSKPSTTSTTSMTSNRTKSQSPAPPPSLTPPPAPEIEAGEAGGISDVISKKPTSVEIKAAHAPVVPQLELTNEGNEKATEDKEQPNQQLAEETDSTPQSRNVPTATTEGSSTSVDAPPNSSSESSNTPARDTVQTSDDSTVIATERSNAPLQAADSAEIVNTENKESGGPSQTGDGSLATDASCPDVSKRSENLLQNEAKSQEANLLQTSGHSFSADVSSSSIGEPMSEEKNLEGGDSDQIVPSS